MPIRITGPYPHRGRVRFRITLGSGSYAWAPAGSTEAEARKLADAYVEGHQEQIALTVERLIESYLDRLVSKGNKPISVRAARLKLDSLLAAVAGSEAASITQRRARELYGKLAASGAAAASHHKALDHARSAWRWAMRQGTVRANPWTEVDKVGRANRGKLQLRADEARKLVDLCVADVLTDNGALAVLMCLLMGLRKSEVEKRVVRDVDHDYTVLVVEDAKTKNGERRPEIPDVLRAAIRLRCQGRPATAPLLATLTGNRLHDKYIEYAIKRYAKLAGVPVVSSHGLRGGFASALVEAGALTHLVAAVMGHGSFERITAKHYATDGALQAAQQKARRKHLKLL